MNGTNLMQQILRIIAAKFACEFCEREQRQEILPHLRTASRAARLDLTR
jgi:hypothetical protein